MKKSPGHVNRRKKEFNSNNNNNNNNIIIIFIILIIKSNHSIVLSETKNFICLNCYCTYIMINYKEIRAPQQVERRHFYLGSGRKQIKTKTCKQLENKGKAA